jgi:hypothetical protein
MLFSDPRNWGQLVLAGEQEKNKTEHKAISIAGKRLVFRIISIDFKVG